jgi:hypothetical protein
MPVPSIRPPGWRLEGTDELENRPNGPKDYNPHDYRDWKQQIAEYEAEGISRPGAILECVVRGAAGAAPRPRAGSTRAAASSGRTCPWPRSRTTASTST